MRINFDKFGPCLAKIAERGKLTDLEARDILQETASRAEQMRRSGDADPFVTAAGELAAQLKEAAVAKRLEVLRNAAKRNAIFDQTIKNRGAPGTDKWWDNAGRTLLSNLIHLNRKLNEAIGGNVYDTATSLEYRWTKSMDVKLRQAAMAKPVEKGMIDRDLCKGIFDESLPGPRQPKTASDPLSKAIEALQGPLREMATRLKAAGATFDSAIGYVTKTSHDVRSMIDAGFSKWWSDTKPRLDEKTFDGLMPKEGETEAQARDRFGQSVYNALITGIHMGSDHMRGMMGDESGYIPPAFEGTHNMAKKFSHQRVLYWKDGDAWYDHMRQYGGMTTLYNTIQQTLRNGAHGIALMDRFGTNPMASLKMIIRRIQETHRDADADGITKFNEWEPRLIKQMGVIDGSLNRPASMGGYTIARSFQMIRNLENIAKLPFVQITHFFSLPATIGSIAPHYGIGRLEAYANGFKNLMEGIGPVEKQNLLSESGAFSHGTMAHMYAQFRLDATWPGKVSALTAMNLKAGGLNYLLENQQNGFRYLLMHHLGRQSDIPYNGLDPLLRDNLGRYGITEPVWDMLRTVPDQQIFEGRRYATPADFERVPDASIDQHNAAKLAGLKGTPEQIAAETARLRAQTRWQLADNYAALLTHAGQEATIQAGARERAMVHLGTRGTFTGELGRMVLQFKMWPLAVINQMYMREVYSASTAGQKAAGIGTFIALSTVAGYFRMMTRDLISGNEPRDITKHPLATLGAAAVQGGGMGILGDFLFGEVNRMGTGIYSTVAGPGVSDAAELLDIFLKFRDDAWNTGDDALHHGRGRFADVIPKLTRWGIHHIPFANYIAVKSAVDYMFWYHLYEAMSPGWFERTNRRMQKEQGRTMIGYRPGAGVPTYPYGLGDKHGFMPGR